MLGAAAVTGRSGPPSVSCIIPTYNRRDWLVEAIASVRGQTAPVAEVVVVDDGSSDGTQETLDTLRGSAADAPLVVLRQDNRGPAAARNAGLRIATGDLVAFLDDDDVWLPQKMARQLAVLMRDPGLALLGCATDTLSLPGGPRVFPVGERRLLFRNWFLTPGVVARRDVLVALGGFPEDMRVCEDYALWLRVAARHRCAFLNEVLVECGHGKPGFGDSGLSADLAALHAGECEAIRRWRAEYAANPIDAGLAYCLALARHLRRRLVAGYRRVS